MFGPCQSRTALMTRNTSRGWVVQVIRVSLETVRIVAAIGVTARSDQLA